MEYDPHLKRPKRTSPRWQPAVARRGRHAQKQARYYLLSDCTAPESPPLSWSREGPWAALRQAAPAPSGLLTLSETEPVDDDACSRCLPVTKHRTGGLCPVASHSIARGRGQQVNSQRCWLRAPGSGHASAMH